ncbi:hypothetical protein EGW08_015716 [Elysia chlorotica]|uniref:G-protein coupled receptors family 2 profile 2 domain-containing protein n=1 Tax=Elysia chlorotica TaxID=188477 RepID=A0A433T4M1_ELYCH|nr:hypothetical protein EGW08_015716 [Elysia chlorotica]
MSNETLEQIRDGWKHFHVKHCGLVCSNGSKVRLYAENVCSIPRCFPCDCDPGCAELDACCPEGVVQPNGSFIVSPEEPVERLLPPYPEQIYCDVIPYSLKTYLQVSSCPPFVDTRVRNLYHHENVSLDTRRLCKEESAEISFVDSFRLFVDVKTGLVFKNKFCALCNGYTLDMNLSDENQNGAGSNFHQNLNKVAAPWELRVNCSHYQSLYTAKTFKDLVNTAKSRTSPCLLFYEEAPSVEQPRRCLRQNPEKYDDLECPEDVMKLCVELNNTYLTVLYEKNIFCHLCAGKAMFHRIRRICFDDLDPFSPISFLVPPITLLLGLSDRKTAFETWKKENCKLPTQWLDDYGDCQTALCTPGKQLEDSGKCVSNIEQIRGLGYKLFVVFLPTKPLMVTGDDIQSLSNYIHESILNVSLESETDVRITVLYHGSDMKYSELQRILVSSNFIGNNMITRDEFEDQLLFLFSQAWTVPRANGTESTIEIKPVLLGEELREFEQDVTEGGHIVRKLSLSEKQKSEKQESAINTKSSSTASTELTTFKPSTKVIYSEKHKTEIRRDIHWKTKSIFIDITHSLACPYVPLNISNTSTTAEKLPMISFTVMGKNISVSSKQKISMVGGQYFMCISLYKRLTDPEAIRIEQSLLDQLQYYIEATCVSLSVVCLFLSSLTYVLFSSLRSLPGMNNLSLCVSLGIAQICLLITARWGINGNLPKEYCVIHAVLLHYAWLASFAWMSVCCIHMFRVFTTKSNKFTDNKSDTKRYLYYCIHGFGVPTFIVIATYATNAIMTSGKSSGYNSELCFLDTRHSIWNLILSMLSPLGLLILTNSVMFVLTIRQIVHVSSLQEQSRSRGRQGVLTYMKLSSLTGLLGAVVVVAVQLNSSVISMLTSPLMALQGFFIFVSFTCNQRVKLLYRNMFRRVVPCGEQTQEKTSSGSSTVFATVSKSSQNQTGDDSFKSE